MQLHFGELVYNVLSDYCAHHNLTTTSTRKYPEIGQISSGEEHNLQFQPSER